jgi:hypothetical protein
VLASAQDHSGLLRLLEQAPHFGRERRIGGEKLPQLVFQRASRGLVRGIVRDIHGNLAGRRLLLYIRADLLPERLNEPRGLVADRISDVLSGTLPGT